MRIAAVVIVLAGLSGCFGAEERSTWAYDVTQLTDARSDGRTGAGVVVAILDTGIDLRHPSLDHLRDGRRDNGEVIAFRDFVGAGGEGVEDAFDDHGHGSHVAGIIVARGSTRMDRITYGVDLLGGAPNVELVVARVCRPFEEGTECPANALPAAVRWAVTQHGAQLISLSLGGPASEPRVLSDLVRGDLENALEEAAARGVLAIASAGNRGPGNADVEAPADFPIVLAVGAIDRDHEVADISSRGAAGQRCTTPLPLERATGRCDPNRKPELVAPGVDILSAWTGDAYVRATGTSQAVPFVTSAAALILEAHGPLGTRADVVELKRAFMETARPVVGQQLPHDRAAGYGIVQAQDAALAFLT